MLNLITIIVGIAMGQLLAGLIAVAILFNEKFLTWYCRKAIRMSKDIVEELEDEF